MDEEKLQLFIWWLHVCHYFCTDKLTFPSMQFISKLLITNGYDGDLSKKENIFMQAKKKFYRYQTNLTYAMHKEFIIKGMFSHPQIQKLFGLSWQAHSNNSNVASCIVCLDRLEVTIVLTDKNGVEKKFYPGCIRIFDKNNPQKQLFTSCSQNEINFQELITKQMKSRFIPQKSIDKFFMTLKKSVFVTEDWQFFEYIFEILLHKTKTLQPLAMILFYQPNTKEEWSKILIDNSEDRRDKTEETYEKSIEMPDTAIQNITRHLLEVDNFLPSTQLTSSILNYELDILQKSTELHRTTPDALTTDEMEFQ